MPKRGSTEKSDGGGTEESADRKDEVEGIEICANVANEEQKKHMRNTSRQPPDVKAEYSDSDTSMEPQHTTSSSSFEIAADSPDTTLIQAMTELEVQNSTSTDPFKVNMILLFPIEHRLTVFSGPDCRAPARIRPQDCIDLISRRHELHLEIVWRLGIYSAWYKTRCND